MVFITGGAYQGKLEYALERFKLSAGDVYYCNDGAAEAPENKKIIYEIDKWILALVKAEENINAGTAASAGNAITAAGAARALIERNPDAIVICNDISCGVVPYDPVQRKWREAVGRAAAELSRYSAEAVRLFCGIPAKLK